MLSWESQDSKLRTASYKVGVLGPYFVLSWVAVLRTVSWDLLSRLLSWDLRHFELCMNYISSPVPLVPSVLSWESQDSVLKSVLTSPCSLHMAKITVLRSTKSCPEFAVLTQDTHFIACCPESGHCPESGQHKIGPLAAHLCARQAMGCIQFLKNKFLNCFFGNG